MQALDTRDIPDLLANLVERSLVVFDLDTWRYSFSESMRAFLLEQEGEDLLRLCRKHFEYFTDYAERKFDLTFEGSLSVADQMYWLEEVNIRSAIDWGMEHDPEGGLHLLTRVCSPWHLAHPAENLQNLTKGMALTPDIDDLDHVWARIHIASYYLDFRKDGEVEPLLLQALAQRAIAEDPRARVEALSNLGWNSLRLGRDEDVATKPVMEALAIAQDHGLTFLQSSCYTLLAEFARSRGHLKQAEHFYSESLRLASNDSYHRSLLLFNFGSNSVMQGEADRAEEQFQESLRERRRAKSTFSMAIYGVGYARALRGDYRSAGLLLGHYEHYASKRTFDPDPIDAELFERMRSLGYEKGGDVFTSAYKEGGALTYDQAYDIALSPSRATTDGRTASD